MQLFPIILIAVVLAADAGLRLHEPAPTPSIIEAGAIVMSMILGVLVLAWAVIWRSRRQLDRDGRAKAILTAERAARYSRWVILLIHIASVLALGWLDAVRATIGNIILLDVIITILPAVLGVIGSWWVFYPIERRIREAMLIRRLDRGQPVHPMPSRWRYIWEQTRMGLLLLLVPLLLIVGLAETIRTIAERIDAPETAQRIIEFATLIAALCVFLIAPLLARVMLSVTPLAAGPLRDALVDICKHHNVTVRDILLWKTSGSMINAAVMGLVGRLRYVLITDALLEAMSLDQVRAVMAHEVGHVRKHHMSWMIITLIAVLLLTGAMIELPLMALDAIGVLPTTLDEWAIAILLIAQLAGVLLIFGWISRRFERQADTFAVEHLSATSHNSSNETPNAENAINPDAVATMCSALQSVAELNAVDPNRQSWRHGSIAWRQHYLCSIIGQPIGTLPIDRTIRRIKITSGIIVISGIIAWFAMTSIPV
jgi:STE24 endopeptidase